MSVNKPIRRIAVVGTGVIGASWAAYYLSRGFDVVATDPAPNVEANLLEYVDNAWPALARAGLPAGASRERLKFTPSMSRALAEADLVQENAPERPDFKVKLFAEMDQAFPGLVQGRVAPGECGRGSASSCPARRSESVRDRAENAVDRCRWRSDVLCAAVPWLSAAAAERLWLSARTHRPLENH
jgi:hypothetical protein